LKLSSKIKVRPKGKTVYSKKRENVKNGIKQQIVQMSNHLKRIHCFKGATWNGMKIFFCRYYYKENFGCRLLVVNSIQRYS
jgi:hypothetical protein